MNVSVRIASGSIVIFIDGTAYYLDEDNARELSLDLQMALSEFDDEQEQDERYWDDPRD